MEIEVPTLLQRKAKIGCTALRKLWLHPDLTERPRGWRPLCSLSAEFFTTAIYDRACLSFSCVLLCQFLSVPYFSPLRNACHQHLGKEYVRCVCTENSDFLITLCPVKYDYKRESEMSSVYVNCTQWVSLSSVLLPLCTCAQPHACAHISTVYY